MLKRPEPYVKVLLRGPMAILKGRLPVRRQLMGATSNTCKLKLLTQPFSIVLTHLMRKLLQIGHCRAHKKC